MRFVKQFRLSIILLFILIIFLFLFDSISKYSSSFLPKGTEYQTYGISFGDLTAYENLTVNGISVSYSNIEKYVVKVVSTDKNYPQIHKIKMYNGVFFDGSYENVCVISEDFAMNFFANLDCIGNFIKISGRDFIIVGVYSIEKSFLLQISGDGTDSVFIPAKRADIVQNIYISDDGSSPNTADIFDFNANIGGKLIIESKIDWFFKANVLSPFLNEIPIEWIPPNGNIFNISHYKSLLIETFQKRNSAIVSYYDNIFWYSIWILFGLLILIIIDGIFLIISVIRGLLRLKEDK